MKKSLKNLIELLKFDFVNDSITKENFPDDGRRGKVEIIDFEKKITSEEAIKEMDLKEYRPATAYELLIWAKDDWNGKDCIMALGSQWRRPDGDLDVLCLWGNAGRRELGLYWVDRGWDGRYRFAFVRKSLESLKTGELGNLESRISAIEEFKAKVENVLKI